MSYDYPSDAEFADEPQVDADARSAREPPPRGVALSVLWWLEGDADGTT
jgi:hypothetical protein